VDKTLHQTNASRKYTDSILGRLNAGAYNVCVLTRNIVQKKVVSLESNWVISLLSMNGKITMSWYSNDVVVLAFEFGSVLGVLISETLLFY